MATNEYDAIVVGSGISGGWAAKELTEKGLKVLMLERGKNIEHIKDYKNAHKENVLTKHIVNPKSLENLENLESLDVRIGGRSYHNNQ